MPPFQTLILALIATVALGALSACGAEPAAPKPLATQGKPEAQAVEANHYAQVLKTHVNGHGLVDYQKLKTNRAKLDTYIESLGALDPNIFKTWNESKQIALLCNAYNAMTLKAIIDHHPIQSSLVAKIAGHPLGIRHISGVWDKLTFPLMGQAVTLEHIEHKMLRIHYNEPRIHMAINCASVGCPPLLAEPFTGHKLNEQLKSQTQRFLLDPSKFRIDREKNKVYLSPIFKWFQMDFVKSYFPEKGFGDRDKALKSILNFASQHLNEADAEYLSKGQFTLHWLKYDWGLNQQMPAK